MAQARKKKRRRKRGADKSRSRGGVLTGMRSGFKNIANTVTGAEETPSKKSSWLSTAITIALVAAALALLFARNRC